MRSSHGPQIGLGYEVPSGLPVMIPLKHLAICGQTQEAGKTTALEALITRAGVAALTFVTKRGEASFRTGRRIDPYFREQTDWQFVASILEASRGEKLKFERAWIIRASRGARTLADVQRNVQRAMAKAKGLSADVYLTLDAYLAAVVPQIATVRWASALQLQPGVNVVDLTAMTVELQHLVIKSALDWVLQRETGTVVVIPEAWKFIPEGRNTPVKLSAEAFIRQGAALGNFLWIDSQDLGGIAKVILRSVPVWILGVQRETNEIKRTLANIPASVAKPKPADIATLGLGQFFACWGRHAIRTYVRPSWLEDDEAQAIATGVVSLDDARAKEGEAMHAEAHALEEANARLQEENERLLATVADLRQRLADLERRPADPVHRDLRRPVTAEDPPSRHRVSDEHAASVTAPVSAPAARAMSSGLHFEPNDLYEIFKARLIAEAPAVLEILVERPELIVKVLRPTIQVDGETLRGRLAQLLSQGFFDEAQTTATASQELTRRGFNTAIPNVSKELGELSRLGFLTRDNKWYRAVPDMRIRIIEAA